jgi:hypothetical protein
LLARALQLLPTVQQLAELGDRKIEKPIKGLAAALTTIEKEDSATVLTLCQRVCLTSEHLITPHCTTPHHTTPHHTTPHHTTPHHTTPHHTTPHHTTPHHTTPHHTTPHHTTPHCTTPQYTTLHILHTSCTTEALAESPLDSCVGVPAQLCLASKGHLCL